MAIGGRRRSRAAGADFPSGYAISHVHAAGDSLVVTGHFAIAFLVP